MLIFKTIHGERIKLVDHILEVMRKHPNVEIRIATDSQQFARHTSYATVVAFRYGTRGVHYVVSKNRIKPKIKDRYTRLFKEAEYSIELAEWITGQINVNIQIDMDYNKDEAHWSNKLVGATTGWAKGLGYKVNIKPESQLASKAADHECR